MSLTIKNKIITETTGWISPSSVSQSNNYGESEWQNLDNVLFWDDVSYSLVNEGVDKNTKSQTIFCKGFNFTLPSDKPNFQVKNVSFRINRLCETIGGSDIKDETVTIGSNDDVTYNYQYWSDKESVIQVYTSSQVFTVADVTSEDFTISFKCKGTGTDKQVGYIYGLQAKVDYTYIDDSVVNSKADYEVKAVLDDNYISNIGDKCKLTLQRYVTNNVTGFISNIYVELSENLTFSDGTNIKTISAENTDEVFNKSSDLWVQARKSGIGIVKIKSASLFSPIILHILVETDNWFIHEYMSLTSNTFNSCSATGLGGGWYNETNVEVKENNYLNNTATVEGANYWNSKTYITVTKEDSVEINTQTGISARIYLEEDESVIINTGTASLYNNNTLLGTANVVNGVATFNYTPQMIGIHNLRVSYSGVNNKYSESLVDFNLDVTKKKTKIVWVDNSVQQYTYLSIILQDSSNNPVVNETLTVIFNNETFYLPTDSEGKAYLMVLNKVGTYDLVVKYNGNSTYENTERSAKIYVIKQDVNIISEDTYCRYGVSQSYSVKLVDSENQGIPEAKITTKMVNFSGTVKSSEQKTNSSGTLNITIDYPVGVWGVTNTFAGNSTYQKLTSYNTVIVYDQGSATTEILLDNTEITGVETENFTISGTVIDKQGNVGIKKAKVNILVLDSKDGFVVNKQVTTNDKGKFSLSSKLDDDSYTYKCIYCGSPAYDGVTSSGNITIKAVGNKKSFIQSTNVNTSPNNLNSYVVQLTDEDGVGLTNKNVYFRLQQHNTWLKYEAVTNEEGYAKYDLSLTNGLYLIESTFLGDEEHDGITNSNYILIKNNTGSKTTLNGTQKNTTVVYTLQANNTVLQKQTCYALEWNAYEDYYTIYESVTNQKGSFEIVSNKNTGIYTYRGIYCGNGTYNSSENSQTVYVPKTKGTVTQLVNNGDLKLYQGEQYFYKATLLTSDNNPIPNEKIITEFVKSNGEHNYIVNTTNIEGEIVIEIDETWDIEKYQVISYFAPSTSTNPYRSSKSTSIIDILANTNKKPTLLTPQAVTTFNYDDDNDFTVTLTDIITTDELSNKEVVFEIRDENNVSEISTYITDTDGEANLPILKYKGTYIVKYTFLGDTVYNQSSGESIITVNTTDTKVTSIESYDTRLTYDSTNGTGNINAKLLHETTPLSNASLSLEIINNITHEIITTTKTTDGSGRIQYSVDSLHVGEYTINISYFGNLEYRPCTKTLNLTILPPSTLSPVTLISSVDEVTSSYGESETITIICDGLTSDEVGQYVEFSFYDRQNVLVTYYPLLVEGEEDTIIATFNTNLLKGGVYDLYVHYPVQTDYDEAELDNNILVTINKDTPVLDCDDTIVSYNNDESIRVGLFDSNDNPIMNNYIILKIGAKSYNGLTGSDGYVDIPINEVVGEYDVVVYTISDDNYMSVEETIHLTVNEGSTNLSASDKLYYISDINTQVYKVKLTSYNKPLVNEYVMLQISHDNITEEYSAFTNELGYAIYELHFSNAGTYNVTAFYSSENFETATDTGVITVSTRPISFNILNATEDNYLPIQVVDNYNKAVEGINLLVEFTEEE